MDAKTITTKRNQPRIVMELIGKIFGEPEDPLAFKLNEIEREIYEYQNADFLSKITYPSHLNTRFRDVTVDMKDYFAEENPYLIQYAHIENKLRDLEII